MAGKSTQFTKCHVFLAIVWRRKREAFFASRRWLTFGGVLVTVGWPGKYYGLIVPLFPKGLSLCLPQLGVDTPAGSSATQYMRMLGGLFYYHLKDHRLSPKPITASVIHNRGAQGSHWGRSISVVASSRLLAKLINILWAPVMLDGYWGWTFSSVNIVAATKVRAGDSSSLAKPNGTDEFEPSWGKYRYSKCCGSGLNLHSLLW